MGIDTQSGFDGLLADSGALPGGKEGGVPTSGQENGGAPRINLDELEDFKKYKASMTQTINERDRRLNEVQRRAQERENEYNQRMTQLEQEMEQRVMAGMDEFGQMQFRAQQEAKKREAAEKRLAEIEQEKYRNEFLSSLEQRYGVRPADDSHPVMALSSVTDMLHQQVQDLQKEVEKYKREAGARAAAIEDAPDLGGGAPVTPVSDIQRAYDKAMLERRGADADRLSRQASERGVQLDRLAFLKAQRGA